MVKRLAAVIALGLLALIILPLITDIGPLDELGIAANKYVDMAVKELGTQNVVTAVLVTYRGLDTIGEVAVLFIATTGIGFVLRKKNSRGWKPRKREQSEILHVSGRFLLPILVIFGIYVFTHGHLSPGGGFQGGVILASSILLLFLSNSLFEVNHDIMRALETIPGFVYVLVGVLGILLSAGFLDSRLLPLGKAGMLFSAGTIPIIYSLIGLKVGAELSAIIDSLGEES